MVHVEGPVVCGRLWAVWTGAVLCGVAGGVFDQYVLGYVDNFTSLVVMMLDYFVFGIVLNRQQILAGIIGFAGITILTLNSQVPT
jgi:hypothetical protein